jgi:plastocyanin
MRIFSGALSAALLLTAATASAQTATVTTSGLSFDPETLTITAGTTVEWTIGAGHNVVQTDGEGSCTPEADGFMSGSSPSDTSVRSFSQLFDTPGTYYYMCNPHCGAGMRGTIVVEPDVPDVDAGPSGGTDAGPPSGGTDAGPPSGGTDAGPPSGGTDAGTSPPPSDDGGCAAAGPIGGGTAMPWLALAGLLLALRMRRRRARS